MPYSAQPPDWREGDELTESSLNQISDSVRARTPHGLPPSGGSGSWGFSLARPIDDYFWAKVTESGGGTPHPHSFVAVVETDVEGVFEANDAGVEGDIDACPLYDVNGKWIPVGTIVRAWLGSRDNYLCEYGCCQDTPEDVDELTEDTPSLDLSAAPGGPSYYLTSDGPWTISSIVPPDDAPDGYEIRLINNNDPSTAPWPLTLLADAPDAPDHPFSLPGGINQAIWPGSEAVLRLALNEPGGPPVWRLAQAPAVTGVGAAPPAIASTPTAVVGDKSATVSWSASAGPPPSSLYLVYYSESSDMSSARLSAVTSSLSVTVPGLTNGTTYYFSIAAVGELGGVAPLSATISVTPSAPAAPAGTPAAIAGDGQVGLTWSLVSGPPAAALYNVYVSTDSGMAGATLAATTASLGATITGLTNGTTYYFAVSSVGSAGSISAMGSITSSTPVAAITTTCCSSVPAVLYVTLTGGSAAGTYTFNYTGNSGGADYWGPTPYNPLVGCDGAIDTWFLKCDSGTWSMTYYNDALLSDIIHITWGAGKFTCTPTYMDSSNVTAGGYSDGTCWTGTCTLIAVSE